MKNQGTMTSPKSTILFRCPIQSRGDYNLPNEEFKINVLRRLSGLQENTEKQYDEMRKAKYNQSTIKIQSNLIVGNHKEEPNKFWS